MVTFAKIRGTGVCHPLKTPQRPSKALTFSSLLDHWNVRVCIHSDFSTLPRHPLCTAKRICNRRWKWMNHLADIRPGCIAPNPPEVKTPFDKQHSTSQLFLYALILFFHYFQVFIVEHSCLLPKYLGFSPTHPLTEVILFIYYLFEEPLFLSALCFWTNVLKTQKGKYNYKGERKK